MRRDLLGVTRPQGPAVDIGAFEFSSVAELRLRAQIIAEQLVLSWNGGARIRLQRAPNLATATWSDVDNSEGQSTLVLPAVDPSGFFRLRGF